MRVRWAVVTGLCAVWPFALAHETKPPPKYGGYVLEADEVFFELVAMTDRLLIYVEEDGKPLDTKAMAGSLAFNRDGRIHEARLRPAGFNLLHAQMARPARGTPLAVKVALSPRAEVRFTYVVR